MRASAHRLTQLRVLDQTRIVNRMKATFVARDELAVELGSTNRRDLTFDREI
jgi:hypothetical protein